MADDLAVERHPLSYSGNGVKTDRVLKLNLLSHIRPEGEKEITVFKLQSLLLIGDEKKLYTVTMYLFLPVTI